MYLQRSPSAFLSLFVHSRWHSSQSSQQEIAKKFLIPLTPLMKAIEWRRLAYFPLTQSNIYFEATVGRGKGGVLPAVNFKSKWSFSTHHGPWQSMIASRCQDSAEPMLATTYEEANNNQPGTILMNTSNSDQLPWKTAYSNTVGFPQIQLYICSGSILYV